MAAAISRGAIIMAIIIMFKHQYLIAAINNSGQYGVV